MQKVACPITMVINPVEIPSCCVKARLSAIPVTTPGNEMGNTTTSEMISRPKNLYRLTAKASAVPKRSAIRVALSPAMSDHFKASRTPVFSAAFDHQIVVNSLGGQEKVRLALNEFMRTTESGT